MAHRSYDPAIVPTWPSRTASSFAALLGGLAEVLTWRE